MPTIDRRRFLAGSAGTAGLLSLGAFGPFGPVDALRALPAFGQGASPQAAGAFTLGVASGDPLPDAVILWTRLGFNPTTGLPFAGESHDVDWRVTSDAAGAVVVAAGTATATAADGYSVHVDATGLSPDTEYHYWFVAGGAEVGGTTRTAPASTSSPSSLRFAFASCQSYTAGYYTAHAHLAQEDVAVVFWLGDFIYENGGGTGDRAHTGGECFTLDDYRTRYALYLADVNLQASRASAPWVVIWDDHETDNNYAGDDQADGAPVDEFRARRAAAYQAWWENQPVRLPKPTGSSFPIYRDLAFGSLATFFAVDGRQYRSDQVCGDALVSTCDDQFDPTRTMLGPEQEAWLFAGLRSSTTTWNVLANQTVFSALPLAGNYNQDQWDGYPVARQRVIDVLHEPGVANPLIITGDIHAAGIADVHLVPEDATSPRVATELVGTSITSIFPAEQAPIVEAIVGQLPWGHYVNAHDHGYTVVELTPTNARAEYRVVSTTTATEASVRTDTTYDVAAEVKAAPTTTTSAPGTIPVVTPRFTG